jgi:hypothetical protein
LLRARASVEMAEATALMSVMLKDAAMQGGVGNEVGQLVPQPVTTPCKHSVPVIHVIVNRALCRLSQYRRREVPQL